MMFVWIAAVDSAPCVNVVVRRFDCSHHRDRVQVRSSNLENCVIALQQAVAGDVLGVTYRCV
jgi:hypothetical protein